MKVEDYRKNIKDVYIVNIGDWLHSDIQSKVVVLRTFI